MTEPVAWKILKKSNWRWEIITDEPSNYAYQEVIPLYTSEQLQPRLKMTQAEFDEFCILYKKLSNSKAMGIINTVFHNESKEFTNLKSLIFKSRGDFFKMLSLFDKFDIDNPEETIEIVPDMKWFVRSKDDIEVYLVEAEEFVINPYQQLSELELKKAVTFDTKEEAELWVTPLTEAVQLPVEGE